MLLVFDQLPAALEVAADLRGVKLWDIKIVVAAFLVEDRLDAGLPGVIAYVSSASSSSIA